MHIDLFQEEQDYKIESSVLLSEKHWDYPARGSSTLDLKRFSQKICKHESCGRSTTNNYSTQKITRKT
jgi:hypothetical protein